MNNLTLKSDSPPTWLRSNSELSKLAESTQKHSEFFRTNGFHRHCGLSAIAAYLHLSNKPQDSGQITALFDQPMVEQKGTNFIQLQAAINQLGKLPIDGSRNLKDKSIEQILIEQGKPLIAGIKRQGRSDHAVTLVGCIPGHSYFYHEPDGSFKEMAQSDFQNACIGILY